jgi:lysosomal Pro-X carboxypeptidase
VTKNFTDSIYVINIADAAHHLDLRADNPADPPSVVEARKLELAQIKKYLGLADTNDDPTFLSS